MILAYSLPFFGTSDRKVSPISWHKADVKHLEISIDKYLYYIREME
jgi:hypothetical protein